LGNDDLLVDLVSSGELGRIEILIVVLSSLEQPAPVSAVIAKAASVGARGVRDWNVSMYFGRYPKWVSNVGSGWRLTSAGVDKARDLGMSLRSPIVTATAKSLEAVVRGISDKHRRDFLSDALLCFDKAAYRPAVVYSWVGAVWILQQRIVTGERDAFNKAGIARFNKNGREDFRPITTLESFGRLQEADLLQLAEDIGLIHKSLHAQLKQRLGLRNGSGHPNSMVVDEHTCAAHINFLIENVYKVF
jgi:hypothetical protein